MASRGSSDDGEVLAAYRMEPAAVLRHFNVTEEAGLSTQQVADARAKWGPNELTKAGWWEEVFLGCALLVPPCDHGGK